MTIKKGAYLGGIRDLEDLRQRCRIDAETGCWVWGLSASHGSPSVVLLMPNGKHVAHRGRRASALLANQFNLPSGAWVSAAKGCAHKDCVNPAHLKVAQPSAFLAERGKANAADPVIRAKMVANGRTQAARNFAKINREIADEIRRNPAPATEMAKLYGLNVSNIFAIRAGKSWADEAPNASVFTWRPAA